MGKVHHYHPETKVYTTTTDAFPNPADPTKDMVPAHATMIAPPTGLPKYHSAVFLNDHWEEKEDYTGIPLFNTTDGKVVENTLNVGDPLPSYLTPEDPGTLDFPKWDGTKWITDDIAQQEAQFAIETQIATEHMEEVLKMLADNEVRKTIPGARVLSVPHEADLRQYILEMENYLDLLRNTGPALIATKNVDEPKFPLQGDASQLNVLHFDSTFAGAKAGIQAAQWLPNSRYEAGQLIYGPNNEGLFVAPQGFTSSPQIGTDIGQQRLVSVMPQTHGLRYPPVADLASLAGLPAEDYAQCKVLDTGDEYVFTVGAQAGDVRDNNNTGFWNQIRSPQHGRYASFSGSVAAATNTIDIGPQAFDVDHLFVFVNGDLRIDTEYAFDNATGIITLNQEMQVNDNWKVLAMS